MPLDFMMALILIRHARSMISPTNLNLTTLTTTLTTSVLISCHEICLILLADLRFGVQSLQDDFNYDNDSYNDDDNDDDDDEAVRHAMNPATRRSSA